MPEAEPEPEAMAQPTLLGLDLGSTGAKAVLISVETGRPLLDIFDRTRGNPVDASRRLVQAILDRGTPDIRAIGSAGPRGVATLCTVFPSRSHRGLTDRGARAGDPRDPDGGDDLSQPRIRGGRSSGLGEQGLQRDTGCSSSRRSPTTSRRFLIHPPATEAAAAGSRLDVHRLRGGRGGAGAQGWFRTSDIFAGFQYSVVHNYLNRVMGQRTLGRKIFFQGKPASNPSLAWTLGAVTGREIVVPPNPGAMGAWGIGLCASEQIGAEALRAAEPLNVQSILDAEITARSEFRCKDPKCQTLCPIERTTISMGLETRVAVSGGACPKFELATKNQPKLEMEAPNPFEQRENLVRSFVKEIPGGRVVALPQAGATNGHIPWLATFLAELGFSVQLLESDASSLANGEQLCNSFDSCGPTKITHAICDTDAELLFPRSDVADPDGPGGQTCVTEQAMPDHRAIAPLAGPHGHRHSPRSPFGCTG
jgi:hypothetical protein